MKIIGLVLAVILILSLCSAQETNLVYSITLSNANGTISETGLTLIDGTAPDRLAQPDGGYELQVISISNETLYSFRFILDSTVQVSAPRDMFDENGNQIKFPVTTPNNIASSSITLVVPYFKNAKFINIYNPAGESVLSIDVSSYSKQGANNPLSDVGVWIGIIIFFILAALILFVLFIMNKRRKQ